MSNNYSGFFPIKNNLYNKSEKEVKPHYKATKQKVKGEWVWLIEDDDERYIYNPHDGKFWSNTGRWYRG
jgi:hypothetical protein